MGFSAVAKVAQWGKKGFEFHYHLNYQSYQDLSAIWEVGNKLRKNWVCVLVRFPEGFHGKRDPVEELKLYRQNCAVVFSVNEGVKGGYGNVLLG